MWGSPNIAIFHRYRSTHPEGLQGLILSNGVHPNLKSVQFRKVERNLCGYRGLLCMAYFANTKQVSLFLQYYGWAYLSLLAHSIISFPLCYIKERLLPKVGQHRLQSTSRGVWKDALPTPREPSNHHLLHHFCAPGVCSISSGRQRR